MIAEIFTFSDHYHTTYLICIYRREDLFYLRSRLIQTVLYALLCRDRREQTKHQSLCIESAWLMSLTCNIKSADCTSSRVDLNASIKWVGKFDIKPTVSDKIIIFPMAILFGASSDLKLQIACLGSSHLHHLIY